MLPKEVDAECASMPRWMQKMELAFVRRAPNQATKSSMRLTEQRMVEVQQDCENTCHTHHWTLEGRRRLKFEVRKQINWESGSGEALVARVCNTTALLSTWSGG